MIGWLMAAWISSCGADLAATHVAFQRGAHEANPLLTKSEGVNAVLISANCAVNGWTIKKLAKTNPKLAWTFAAIGMTGHGVAVTINLKAGR